MTLGSDSYSIRDSMARLKSMPRAQGRCDPTPDDSPGWLSLWLRRWEMYLIRFSISFLFPLSFPFNSARKHSTSYSHVRQRPRRSAVSPPSSSNAPSNPTRLDSLVSTSSIQSLAIAAGLSIPASELEDWSALLSGLNHCAKEILALPDYYPAVDTALYPRTDIHLPVGPEATDKGGWAWKARVEATQPKSNELKGLTVALKDNIALAGVKCTNGTEAVDWTPEVDATLVTRILDAGGLILGKASCENNCFGAVRFASHSFPNSPRIER